MSTQGEEQGAESSPGKKAVLPLVIAVAIGLIGGGGGAFVVAPLLAERAPAAAPKAEKSAKAAAKDHAEEDADHGDAAEEEHAEEEEYEEEDHGSGGGEGDHGKAGGAAKIVHSIENIVLNPAGTGGTRFLMVTVAFDVKSEAVAADMKARDAELRDAVLQVLETKSIPQLANIAVRDSLKIELKTAATKVFKKGSVRKVYLPQFVIQ